jgi:transcriptional regulator with XRE-family HTH domain
MMREAAKMSLEVACVQLDKTPSALSRIEQGKTRADVHLVRTMMDVYDQNVPGLLERTRQAMKPGWWVTYGIRDMGYVDVETEASVVRELALLPLPGLLQTEAYMRALFDADPLSRSKKQLANDIAVRMIRRQRLTDERNPLRLVAVVDDTALRKTIGGPEVMREQLRHLVEMAALPTVDLRVLPDELYGHGGVTAAFTVLEFPDSEDPGLLYVEYPTGATHIEEVPEVTRARLLFDHLNSLALDPADSVALIERVL